MAGCRHGARRGGSFGVARSGFALDCTGAGRLLRLLRAGPEEDRYQLAPRSFGGVDGVIADRDCWAAGDPERFGIARHVHAAVALRNRHGGAAVAVRSSVAAAQAINDGLSPIRRTDVLEKAHR